MKLVNIAHVRKKREQRTTLGTNVSSRTAIPMAARSPLLADERVICGAASDIGEPRKGSGEGVTLV